MTPSSRLIPVAKVRRNEASSSSMTFSDERLLGLELGELAAHLSHQPGHQPAEGRLGEAEVSIAVTHGAAENTADDVPGLDVDGQLPVGDGEKRWRAGGRR